MQLLVIVFNKIVKNKDFLFLSNKLKISFV